MDQPAPGRTFKKHHLGIAAAGVIFLVSVLSMRGCRPNTDHRKFTVDQLGDQARQALAVIDTPANRRARRPVGFDDVLRPVDMLLAKAKDALADAVRAQDAGDLARREQDFNLALQSAAAARDFAEKGKALSFATAIPTFPRTYRWPDQMAEASRYIATVYWARLRADPAFAAEFARDPDFSPPPDRLDPIRREIARGVETGAKDKELRYLEGVTDFAAGDWAGAAAAFGAAIDADDQYAEAYAGLGKAAIAQGDFGAAEKAFDDAIVVGEKRKAGGQGAGPLLTALHNAATFHDHLCEYYRAADPTEENRAALQSHRERALACYRRYLQGEGESDPATTTAVLERVRVLSER